MSMKRAATASDERASKRPRLGAPAAISRPSGICPRVVAIDGCEQTPPSLVLDVLRIIAWYLTGEGRLFGIDGPAASSPLLISARATDVRQWLRDLNALTTVCRLWNATMTCGDWRGMCQQLLSAGKLPDEAPPEASFHELFCYVLRTSYLSPRHRPQSFYTDRWEGSDVYIAMCATAMERADRTRHIPSCAISAPGLVLAIHDYPPRSKRQIVCLDEFFHSAAQEVPLEDEETTKLFIRVALATGTIDVYDTPGLVLPHRDLEIRLLRTYHCPQCRQFHRVSTDGNTTVYDIAAADRFWHTVSKDKYGDAVSERRSFLYFYTKGWHTPTD